MWPQVNKQEGEAELAEFFVYACRQCGCAYAGALEATEHPHAFWDRTSLCGDCLEQLVGWGRKAEEVESREESSGSSSDA